MQTTVLQFVTAEERRSHRRSDTTHMGLNASGTDPAYANKTTIISIKFLYAK